MANPTHPNQPRAPDSPAMTSSKLYLRLLQYVRPYWRVFLVAVASMAVVAASEPAFPALLKPLLDGSFVSKDPASIRMVPLLLIGLFLLRGIFTFISAYTIAWVANRLVMDLRALMFHKMVNLPTRYYDNTSSGAAIANVAFNVSQVADAGTNVITVLVRDTLTVVGLLGWMFYLNWKLSLIALAIAPVIVLIVRSFSGRLRRMSRNAQRSMGDITHVLDESLEGHKVVKIFGGQEYEYQRFREAANRVRLFNMKQTVASAANVPLVQL
ncbi:MAG: ABC transporter transmembrane domain-containing protein, partial [Sulfuricella sp.]|nr:ABC transporter transmembrane domain-containing protein [Sulfuricella sp.]